MDYRRTASGAIQSEYDAEGLSVIFQAKNVRKEHTGIHALITLGFSKAGKVYPCKEDNFNVGRLTDRERLVNQVFAHSEFSAIFTAAKYSKTQMSTDLMGFARGLWDYALGALEPAKRGGSLERRGPEFVLKPFAIKGGGTIVFAPPGAGKSWIGYIWATCVDAGIDRFWEVKQAPALLVNLERGEESVDTRFGDVNEALRLPRDRHIFRLDRRGAAFTDIADAVERVVRREGIGLVVLDSLSRMGLGKMIDDDVANRGMDALNRLNTTWVVLAHTPRADATHTYGSQMFDAAADMTVQLMADDKSKRGTLGLGLKLDKRNDVPPMRDPFQIALEFDERGLTRIRRSLPGEFVEIDSQRKQTAAEMVREFMNREQKGDAAQIAEAIGVARQTVVGILATPEYVKVGKEGRNVVYGRVDWQHNEVSDEKSPTLPDSTTAQNEVLSEPITKGPTHDTSLWKEENPF